MVEHLFDKWPAISRAAQRLVHRGLGTVKAQRGDRRLRRFHITQKGRDLLEVVETETAEATKEAIGADNDYSDRYYQFTVHLWNLTRFLPEGGCGNEEYFFPTEMPADAMAFLPMDESPFRELVEPLWAMHRRPANQNEAE